MGAGFRFRRDLQWPSADDGRCYTRECPAIEVDTGISSRQVTRTLDQVIAVRGTPATLRCDNVLNARGKFGFLTKW